MTNRANQNWPTSEVCEIAEPLSPALIRAYRSFVANAGYVVGHRAECALNLARAEQCARDNDWNAEWERDADGCIGCDCGNANCKCNSGEPHEVLGCVLKDSDGNHLASLWGICEPDNAYRRVVEAELAAEAMANERELNRIIAD